ncbi:hypothetical protein DPY74_22065 [Salmonella enterica subsp. salamae]|nr:hypothetical protein [Salmonella enterica subsp. salamae]KSB60564.1 hypothetical protein LFZ48_14095 [Salmonella enterica subsp. salamae serovar 56:z10:e,n,x str. 1369-73]
MIWLICQITLLNHNLIVIYHNISYTQTSTLFLHKLLENRYYYYNEKCNIYNAINVIFIYFIL